MTNVLVSGCSGEMGRHVCELILKDPNMQVVVGFDAVAMEFSEFPVVQTLEDLEFYKREESIDVIIDFSAPECTNRILEFANLYKIPIIIATTGLSDETAAAIKNYSKKIPIFRSDNMSYEIPFLKKILQQMAPQLVAQDYDIEICETHHNRKKDSPSGTAKLLATAINESLDNPKEFAYGRTGKRQTTEIGISSIRGGDIVGEHSVLFFGPNETIELKHTAHSRKVFAEGAIKAAKFLVDQKPGLYSMDDLV